MKKFLAFLAVFVVGIVIGAHGAKCPVLKKVCPFSKPACCVCDCACGDVNCCCAGNCVIVK